MGLLQRTFWGAVVTGVVLAPGVQSASAMPVNDVRTSFTKIFTRDPSFVGVRLIAEKVGQPGVTINPEKLTGAFNDDGDTPLLQPLPVSGLQASSTCPARADVALDPANRSAFYATRTVWYELTQDSSGAPFSQRMLVTVDSAATDFPSALAVYEGSAPPPAFTAGVSPFPTNIVACDRNLTTGIVPSVVSFITNKNKRYFLEAGVAPVGASSGTNLRLAMRVLDVTPPTVSVILNNTLADVDADVFEYSVGSDDVHATRTGLTVVQARGSTPLPPLKAAPGISRDTCGENSLKSRARIGQYCADGAGKVYVRWRGVASKKSDFGKVTATFRDLAGNSASSTLKTPLRDTTPPTISDRSLRIRWSRRGRLFLAVRCAGGPGSIQVQYASNGRKPANASKNPKTFKRRGTMVLKAAFQRVHRQNVFVHVLCFDTSGNKDDRWLFLPR